MWTEGEERLLTELGISPARHKRGDLKALIRHFKAGGRLYSVIKKGRPVRASLGFVRKLRRLVQEGEVDWLLDSEEPVDGTTRPKALRDEELVRRHKEELYALAQKFRDGVYVPYPTSIFDQFASDIVKSVDIFEQNIKTRPRFEGEESPDFPYLRMHLWRHPCWDKLKELQRGLVLYRRACSEVYKSVRNRVSERLPEATEHNRSIMTDSLLLDAVQRAEGGKGPGFSYHSSAVKNKTTKEIRWRLELAAWAIETNIEADAERFKAAHMQIRDTLPDNAIKELVEQYQALVGIQKVFVLELQPESRLRKAIWEGSCDLCQ